MSTKLHHGFRVSHLITLDDVQVWWRKLSDNLALVREAFQGKNPNAPLASPR